MDRHDWGVLLLVATLGFSMYFTMESARTDRVKAMGSIIVACAESCEGRMVSASPCACDR